MRTAICTGFGKRKKDLNKAGVGSPKYIKGRGRYGFIRSKGII